MAATLDRRARKLVERIRKNHSDHEAVEALATHYAKAGDHASLANLMEGFADTLEDAGAAADAYVRAADSALMMSDRPRAEALYERALSREPRHSEALDRALRVAESARDFEGMRRILGGVIRAEEARGAPRKQLAALHFRLGQLFETHLDDPDRAAGLYRIAIDNNPLLVSAMVAARRLYSRAGNHAAVSVLYEFEIDATKLAADKHALLLALADHTRENCDDLNGAIAALRRACKLAPDNLSSLQKLANALIARSESAGGAAAETDIKRAAEVYYQLARAVPRADATPLLLHALALAPEHARASALLHELRGHAAVSGNDLLRGPHAGVSQLVVDQRATRQVRSPLDEANSRLADVANIASEVAAAEPLPTVLRDPAVQSEAERTSALSTGDLVPMPQQDPARDANQTMALSTDELIPLRNLDVRRSLPPPPLPPDALRVAPLPPLAAPAPQNAVEESPPPTQAPSLAGQEPALATQAPSLAGQEPALATQAPTPPIVVEERADPAHPPAPPPSIATELSAWPKPILASELEDEEPALELPHVPRPTRARIVEQLELDASRMDLEVNLGVTTDSNLYVDMGDRLADGGVFAATYQSLTAGTAIALHITLPGSLHADAHGRVTLRRESLDAFDDPAPGVCIAFEALTSDALALLERFAAKRTPWLIDDD
jgi:tetratricopeptide (TPR) repeat protein